MAKATRKERDGLISISFLDVGHSRFSWLRSRNPYHLQITAIDKQEEPC